MTPAPPVPVPTPATPGESAKPSVVKPGKAKIASVKKKGKNKCLVKLKKVKNASGYQIVYATDKSFKKNVKKITTKKLSCTIKKLRKGKKYYFRARAFVKSSGKTIYGSYSSKKTKKIG